MSADTASLDATSTDTATRPAHSAEPTPSESEPAVPVELQPFDEHNQRLLRNVHPTDWRNPEPKGRYQLVAVGGGTAGLVSAIVAGGLGANSALIERHLLGGDCLNVGCVPSKGVISAARAWRRRHRQPFGAPAIGSDGDFAAAMERMRRIRADISRHDSARRFQDEGVDVYLGHARFVGGDAIEVGGRTVRFRRAVITTGARAAAPPIPGLDQVDYLTNESIFSLTELPRHLVVIGAGPIGCEMSQSFAQFGCKVTLLDMANQVLGREDRDAAEVVQRALAADGVELELGSAIQRIEARGSDQVVVYERAGQTHEIVGDRLLVAVGRKPNLEDLGLEEAGVEYDRRGVAVDDRLRTSNPRIYAAGDITPHYKFTHLADAHAAIVIQNALFFGRKKVSDLVVPWCTYTTPEIAHVGLYEHDAEAQGVAVDVIRMPFADVDRAVLDGEDEGFLKLVVKRGSDRVLGATLVASHAGDMLATLCLAVTHGIGLGKFASTIFPYPTQGEVFKKAANAWRKTKLSPAAKKILGVWFRIFS